MTGIGLGRRAGNRGRLERPAADQDAERPRRVLTVRAARPPVKGRQVDREPLGDQPAEHGQERGDRLALARAGGDGQVRPTAEDVADHPGAGRPRADLDEGADAVLVGPADDGREVDAVQGVGEDRVGRRVPVTGYDRPFDPL